MRLLIAALFLLVVVTAHDHDHDHHDDHDDHDDHDIVDKDRACPDGFFYAGEPSHKSVDPNTRDEIWEEGPASPVYSCYKFVKSNSTFAGGSLACNEAKAELVSINDDFEGVLLVLKDFYKKLPDQMGDDLKAAGETEDVWTSGIQLAEDTWTWFGADETIASDIDIEENTTTDAVQCLAVRWEKDLNGTALVFTSVPCTQTMQTSLCEVRVYTQIWYVWVYTNWLQILFFLTMGILLLSTCCMFQALFRRRTTTISRQPVLQASPPPYTPHPHQAAADTRNKYAEKGREMLAKITFFKPKDEEKVRLSDA